MDARQLAPEGLEFGRLDARGAEQAVELIVPTELTHLDRVLDDRSRTLEAGFSME